MSLESFYGGKQGLSSIIKKSFKYISENDPAFVALGERNNNVLRGGTRAIEDYSVAQREALDNDEVMEYCLNQSGYEDVWYGELCIINTVNKNNPANGCLFRRTLSRQGTTYPIDIYGPNGAMIENADLRLSAEYIGQIVGPQSGTPFMSIGTLTDIDELAQAKVLDYTETRYEIDENNVPVIVTDEALPAGNITYRHDGTQEGMFVPGKTTDNQGHNIYNDNIQYNWFNVRNPNTEEENTESWVYLGVQIPYLVQDFAYATIDYWEKITCTDRDTQHLFYQDWLIELPRGVRGNGPAKIRKTTLAETANVYISFDVAFSNSENKYVFNDFTSNNKVTTSWLRNQISDPKPASANATMNTVPFYVCDFTLFNSTDLNGNGITRPIYIGVPKDISSFALENDGTLTINYQDKSTQSWSKKLKWIDSITFNTSTGVQTITYNTGDTTDFNLNIPNSAKFDQSTGVFTIGTTNRGAYNLKDADNIANDFKFRYPINVTLRGDVDVEDYNQSRQIAITYNINPDGTESPQIDFIGDPVNYIQDMVLVNDVTKPYNGHLLVLFNDPIHRPTSTQIDSNNQWQGKTWYNNITGTNAVANANIYWWDIGSPIGYYDGLITGEILNLVRTNSNDSYTVEGEQTPINVNNIIPNLITYLANKYPAGLTDLNRTDPNTGSMSVIKRQGEVVAVVLKTNGNIDITHFFGYDYNARAWKLIESRSSNASDLENSVDMKVDRWSYSKTLAAEGSTLTQMTLTTTAASGLYAPWIHHGTYPLGNIIA